MRELTELRELDLYGGYDNSGGQITYGGLVHLKDLTRLGLDTLVFVKRFQRLPVLFAWS